ncbi:hypothetical protein, partial [Lactobacillus acidophilus]|uniref:hypothetical protein n=1 Tax=Lactobacillus acidophilus TaxID=1579 RepID=UPI001ADC26B7
MTAEALDRLGAALAAAGASLEPGTTSGDARYQVHIAGLSLPDATAAGLSGLRRAVADAAIPG